MVSLKSILLLATTATALVLETRTPAQVLKNLQNIDKQTNTLTGLIQSWDGSVNGAVAIQNQETTLEKAVNSTATAAQKEPQAACPASKKIVTYVKTTLEPDIVKSLNALKAKKPQFQSLGLTSTVKSDLQKLKSGSDTLGAALVKAACPAQKQPAQALVTKIDADFNNAIAAFS